MGEKISHLLNSELKGDETVLQSLDLKGVAGYLASDQCQKVFVMVGCSPF
jgi:hypothetical protein